MIVLDTHALIWWLCRPSELSVKAKRAPKNKAILESQPACVRYSTGFVYVPLIFAWRGCVRRLTEGMR
jgi:hypothetical protein